MTAAQWIWCEAHLNPPQARHAQHSSTCLAPQGTNLLCFVAHTFMVFYTFHMAYWRWGRSMFLHEDTQHMGHHLARVANPDAVHAREQPPSWSPG